MRLVGAAVRVMAAVAFAFVIVARPADAVVLSLTAGMGAVRASQHLRQGAPP